MSTLKERLQEVMLEYDLKTQQQLADFAGVSKGLVGQWFKGDTGLGAKPLLAFEKKTHFSPLWLCEGKGNKYKENFNNLNIQEIKPETALSGSQIALEMPDNSFAPHIPQGSELLCDTNQTAITDGKIYQIQHGNLRFIRRVFRQISGSLKLSCDNPSFDDTTISPDQIQIIGRIVQWRVVD